MKKTTWIIIGLSVCVVVLAAALGVVLSQKKTETIFVREPDPYTSHFMFSKPWQEFYLSRLPKLQLNYVTRIGPNITILPAQKGVFLYHNGKVYGMSSEISKNELLINWLK